MKRTLCMIFASLIALSCFSCSETTPSSEESPSDTVQKENQPTDSSAAVTETEAIGIPEPELPEQDYGGADFTILTRGHAWSFPDIFMSAESLNGEVVNDAIFNRNLSIEEKFNLNLHIVENENAAGEVQKLVMGGDTSVDVVDTQATSLATISTKGYLANFLSDIPYVNLAAEYWSENVMNDLQIDGRLYMMISDMSMERLDHTFLIFFNKELINQYDLESPYTLVDENRWTLDKYLEYIGKVSKDLNGDGVYDKDDLYGLLYESDDIAYYTVCCGIRLTERSEENGLVCTLLSEKTEDVVNKMKTCFDSRNSISYSEVQKYVAEARPLFANRQYLFLPCGMFEFENLREMQDDFGVVPMPKYNEEQESYYHRIHPMSCIFSIPTSCSDYERAGLVMEYGSWVSNKLLLPAYYETTIKQKRIRDEKASEMVDIVRMTTRLEIGEVFDLNISRALSTAMTSGDLASRYAKFESKIESSIEKLFNSYSELD